MTYPTFPTLSTKSDQKYYEETPEDPAIRTEMEGGYEYTRPRFTRKPRKTWTIGYTAISTADKLLLESFWNTVKGGSDGFYWPHPFDGKTYLVRFTDTPPTHKYAHYRKRPDGTDDHRWDVSAIKLREF